MEWNAARAVGCDRFVEIQSCEFNFLIPRSRTVKVRGGVEHAGGDGVIGNVQTMPVAKDEDRRLPRMLVRRVRCGLMSEGLIENLRGRGLITTDLNVVVALQLDQKRLRGRRDSCALGWRNGERRRQLWSRAGFVVRIEAIEKR